jgi:hypothetical protein
MVEPISMKIAVPNGLLFVRDSKVHKYPSINDETAFLVDTNLRHGPVPCGQRGRN